MLNEMEAVIRRSRQRVDKVARRGRGERIRRVAPVKVLASGFRRCILYFQRFTYRRLVSSSVNPHARFKLLILVP